MKSLVLTNNYDTQFYLFPFKSIQYRIENNN